MPKRTIPPKYRGQTGIHANPGGRRIAYESTLERDFITLSLFSPKTISIEEQPVKVSVPGKKGRSATYIPDFLLIRVDAMPSLVEIKYSDDLKTYKEIYKDRFAAAKEFSRQRGWSFDVLTEVQIRDTKLENATFFLPLRYEPIDDEIKNSIRQNLLGRPRKCSVADVVTSLGIDFETKAKTLRALWCLIAKGIINADFSKPINMETQISISGWSY